MSNEIIQESDSEETETLPFTSILPLCGQITTAKVNKSLPISITFPEDNDDNFGFNLQNLITSVCRSEQSEQDNDGSLFSCDNSSCSQKFKRKKYMIEHYKREHLNEISNICDNCCKEFYHRSCISFLYR